MFIIDWPSLAKKKVPAVDDYHGIYFVCGRQGSGKTYMAINYVKDLNFKKVKIVTNIHSMTLPHEDFQHINDIVNDVRNHTCYVIDEVSKKYPKNAPPDKAFYAWLQQSRKRKRVVILITQEWKELPMWLRRPTKYAITTKPVMFVGKRLGLYITSWGDGENMILDESMEWVCPTVKSVLHKRNKYVAGLYDTFEPVESL